MSTPIPTRALFSAARSTVVTPSHPRGQFLYQCWWRLLQPLAPGTPGASGSLWTCKHRRCTACRVSQTQPPPCHPRPRGRPQHQHHSHCRSCLSRGPRRKCAWPPPTAQQHVHQLCTVLVAVFLHARQTAGCEWHTATQRERFRESTRHSSISMCLSVCCVK